MVDADRTARVGFVMALFATSACTVFNGLEADPAATLSAGYAETVLADAPLVYLRLDETSGKVAVDASGHGHDGTYDGTTFVASGALAGNGAVELDGFASIDLGKATDFAFVDNVPFSIEVWFETTSASFQKVVSRDTGEPPDRLGYHMFFRNVDATGALEIGAEGFAAVGNCLAVTSGGALNRFTHVVATFDGTKLRTYVDGELAATSAMPCPSLPSVDVALSLGRRADGTNGLKGALDEVAIYGVALADDRIRAHFAAAQPP